jgi:hypothetical protein
MNKKIALFMTMVLFLSAISYGADKPLTRRDCIEIINQKDEEIEKLKSELIEKTELLKQKDEEIAKLKTELVNAKPLKRKDEDINKPEELPFTGEETPLTMVEAYPEKYIGKTFIAIGAIEVKDYYNYRYENAKETHISLAFDELRRDKSQTTKSMDLYLRREISKNLVEEITKTVNAGYRFKLIRVKVSIPENRYDPDCSGIMAELIDWQFLSSDKKSWQDWVIGEETVKPSDKVKGVNVYRGKEK